MCARAAAETRGTTTRASSSILAVCPEKERFAHFRPAFFPAFTAAVHAAMFTTYFSEFGVSDVAAGTYYGAWGTAITAYGIATGFAIDAMGVRRSLVACYALQTLARLILAFTSDATVAVVTLFTMQALATSWGAPVMTIAIKRLVADADRVMSFGLFYSVMNVSALLSGVAIDLTRLALPASGFESLGGRTPIRGVVLSTALSSVLALAAATRFTDQAEVRSRPRTGAERCDAPRAVSAGDARAAEVGPVGGAAGALPHVGGALQSGPGVPSRRRLRGLSRFAAASKDALARALDRISDELRDLRGGIISSYDRRIAEVRATRPNTKG